MSNSIDLRPAEWGHVARLKAFADKESVQMKPDNGQTKYIGAFAGDHIVAFVGWMVVGSKVRYKADFVFKKYRGQKIYTKLWDQRDIEVYKYMKSHGLTEITAYCTKMSLPMYVKMGFKEVSTGKTGIVFVKKIIK